MRVELFAGFYSLLTTKAKLTPFRQGAVNALLTLRIGYVTKAYLMEGPEALAGVRNKRAVKRQAIKSAFKALPGIIGSSATSLGKGLTGFVARMASKGEKQ